MVDHWAAVDFDGLARKLSDHMADLLHRPDGEPLHGHAFYAEALRRALRYGSGLMPEAEARSTIESHTVVDRANREAAERRVAELLAEQATARAKFAAELAEELARLAGNENAVAGKYRREGVAYAARHVLAVAEYEQRIASQQAAKART
jgi:hypothetical protein